MTTDAQRATQANANTAARELSRQWPAGSSEAALRDRATHTGTQPASTISNFQVACEGYGGARYSVFGHAHANAVAAGAAGFMTGADKTKLDGVASGATANSTDAALRARGSHTGTQLANTISDFDAAADARIGAASVNALADVVITAPSNTQVLKFNGTNWVNAVDATGGGGSVAIAVGEVDLGANAVRSGHATLTDATITATDKLLVSLAPGPYTGKGTLADEAELSGPITFSAVAGTGSATLYWSSAFVQRGNVKVNYLRG